MSNKYRRVCSNIDIKDKKKLKNNQENHQKPSYLDTKFLMEKLGIKITNEDIYKKKGKNHISQYQLKSKNVNITSTLNNENNSENFKSKSTRKRNKNDKNGNNNNKKNKQCSYEKRIITKEKDNNKRTIENKDTFKKEKEVNNKIKKIKEIKENNINTNENNENPSKKKIGKKDYHNQESQKVDKVNRNYIKMKSQNQDTRKVTFKKHKDKEKEKDDINKVPSIKIYNKNKGESTNNILSMTSRNKEVDELGEALQKMKNKKKKEKQKQKQKGKEKKEEEVNKKEDENQKKFKKNKAISADKITEPKIFNFRSSKKKKKVSDNNNSSGSDSEESSSESEYTVTSKSSEDSEESDPDPKTIERSKNRKLTELSYKNKEKILEAEKKEEEEEKLKNEKNEKNNQEEKEKEIVRANKKNITEMPPQNQVTNDNKKKNATIENERKSSNKRYLRRRSMDNPMIREKYELMMTGMLLKQNGGNSLFLKNYEKGCLYEKEIEVFIRNKKVKKKIKISSCTKAGCSGPGIVKTNQDAYFIKDNFLKDNVFIGVCDGHGEKGELISNYVCNKLPDYIKDLKYDNITNAFKKINNEVYNNKSMDSNMSGTTIVSLILTTDKIICINLGDSRAAVFKYDSGLYYCKNLSRDHKPSEPDENKRIINNNGRIKKCYDEQLKKYLGPDRVWLKNKDEPGLAMTRSIGDKIAHSVGVSDEPECKHFEYEGNEKFIIVASDGIWEYLHGDDCIRIVRPFYEEKKDCEEAALTLVKEAFRKWKRKEIAIDDITVVVLFFDE